MISVIRASGIAAADRLQLYCNSFCDGFSMYSHLCDDLPWTTLSSDVSRPGVVAGEVTDRLMSQREAFRTSTVHW